jgi:hypothetical protein
MLNCCIHGVVHSVRALPPHCGNVKSLLISSPMSAEEVGEKGKERERLASYSTLLLLPHLPPVSPQEGLIIIIRLHVLFRSVRV